MGIYDRDYERNRYQGDGPIFGTDWSMTTWIIVVTVAAWIVQIFWPPFTTLIELPERWFERPWEFYRLISYGFAHATYGIDRATGQLSDTIDIWHIAANMLLVFFIGRALENRYGSREFLAFYLVAILCAGLCWNVAELLTPGPTGAIIGASGADAAILVVFALNYPRQQLLVWGVFPVPAWVLASVALLLDISGAVNRSGNVAYTAHIGGALFGFLYYRNNWQLAGWLPRNLSQFKPRMGPKLKVHRGDPDDNDADDDAADKEVERILAKITAQGQDSLTARERKTLEQASKRYQQRRKR